MRPARSARAHLLADPDRPVEDRLLEAALFLHRAGRGGVDLLEDARHRGEVGRFQFGQVGHDLQRVALPVGDRRAEVEAAELDQQGEGVGEGEVEVGEVFVLDHAGLVDHVEHRPVVAVADDAALRRPGRARGVDEGADVLRGDRLPARLPLGGVAAGAAGGEVVERDRVLAGAGHPHHVLEQRQLVADRADLLQLLVVLDDDDLGVGVLEHVLALLGRVGLVDRDDGGAGRERGEVEVGPLGAGVGEDRDLVALGDAEVDQAEGERADDLADLGEAAARPTRSPSLKRTAGALP